jgi:hypothetical protein
MKSENEKCQYAAVKCGVSCGAEFDTHIHIPYNGGAR